MISPASVLHIATEDEWADAQRTGEVHPASLDREGFVHCSTAEQLPRTLSRHFADVDHLVVLEIDPAHAGVELKSEDAGGGEAFPHLYGPVPIDAVTGVRPTR